MAKTESVVDVEKVDVVQTEREVELVFISDGVYKYIYTDTKEDVV
jgi:hypothetical protein